MIQQLEINEKNEKLYLPEAAKITKVKSFTKFEKFFEIELLNGRKFNHEPGQFVQISVLGIGEAPISVSSPPDDSNKFEICVRSVGTLTNKLHTLNVGDPIFIRGPFGHGFDNEILNRLKGKHLLFVAGGIGYVPVRSLINKVLNEKDDYKKISILYGCKTPEDRMFTDELESINSMGTNVELIETVDNADENWKGNVGVITTLIPKVELDPENCIAIVVGPPIMYKFVIMSLMDLKFKKNNIYISLERRMKCGIGKCGHCQMEGVYVCQEGPVFNYADVANNKEVF